MATTSRHPLRPLHLIVSPQPAGQHEIDAFAELARTAERGLLDAVHLEDRLALPGWEGGAVAGGLEPLTLLAAVAAATEHLGLIATASTTFYEPYLLARALASLDHISHGRAGWTIGTGGGLDEAANFSLDEPVEDAVRFERAAELLDVVTQLWDSWADDAVAQAQAQHRAAGRGYADPRRVREIEHTGLFFKVRGPLNVQRTPQGWPVLAQQAGNSADDAEFAARYAETVFTTQHDVSSAATFAKGVKARAAAYGREPRLPLILPGIVPVIGSTNAEAQRLLRQLAADDWERPDGAPEQLVVVGTPDRIADVMQEWARAGAADGFTIRPPQLAGGLTTFVDQVVPLLQARGLFRTEYQGGTLRERFGLPRPEDHFPAAGPAARSTAAWPALAAV